MPLSTDREYQCGVVGEGVRIHLRTRRTLGPGSADELFVQCDQSECQNVDENCPPCPLNLSMFEVEIKEREEKARLRREESDHHWN